jgi:L-seryl-tRNA(Ser) seleniumtransferase
MNLRELPSVDRLLRSEPGERMVQEFGRDLSVVAIRHALEAARQRIKQGDVGASEDELVAQATRIVDGWLEPSLLPVVNATGVILHTNLGRAPLSPAAREAMLAVASQYSTLEYDLPAGERGHRDAHIEGLLTRLTGAESALVVNNNAAAVLLALTALSAGREAIISRTQLIEIGGGFRIPEVLDQSGAHLIEVGTTNRTHLRDYQSALTERTGLILRAHHSNFRLVGFTTEPTLPELVELAHEANVPLVDDLGSGAFLDTAPYGLAHEPMVQESLQAGVPLVTFSGDKLLGGPQAGILVGEAQLIERLRSHPLARAVRPDKLCLAALAETLRAYLLGQAIDTIPVWQMISAQPEGLRQRVDAWIEQLGDGSAVQGQSTVGGGSLPAETLPSWLLRLEPEKPTDFAAALRRAEPPVIARIEDDGILLDPRTVLPWQDEQLLAALQQAQQDR